MCLIMTLILSRKKHCSWWHIRNDVSPATVTNNRDKIYKTRLIIAKAATKVTTPAPARADCAAEGPAVVVVFVPVLPDPDAFAAAWKLLKLRTELSTVLTALL